MDTEIKYILPWSGSSEITCSSCGGRKSLKNRCINLNLKSNQGQYVCRKCSFARDGTTDKIKASLKKTCNLEEHKFKLRRRLADNRSVMSAASKEAWSRPEYRARQSELRNTEEFQAQASARSILLWADATFRSKMQAILKDIARRNKNCLAMRSRWSDNNFRNVQLAKYTDEHRAKLSACSRELWDNLEYADKMRLLFASDDYKEKIRTADRHMPVVSNIQQILYSTLDDLDVKYHRERSDSVSDEECSIGPYSFDCVIPRKNRPTLLIECQGDYWHNREISRVRDRQKASYIANNFAGQYELKYIWEHEFKNRNRVVETLKYWLGVNQQLEEFCFETVKIDICPAVDYKLLLGKYHYLANAGRCGIAFGAYLNGQLIATCVFSSLIRHNIRTNGYLADECKELSRLCIHPKFQKKNFASWFVARCLKRLDPKCRLIIAYCDTTFGHSGAVYKACNFIADGEVKPDYWYVATDGWAMHKKALYEHANSLKLTEAEFANKYQYKKVWGQKKLRFIFERNR